MMPILYTKSEEKKQFSTKNIFFDTTYLYLKN
jgi:hypothetical protein